MKILRFLQDLNLERVGGRESIPVKVRVIAATKRDLDQEIREGRFREDLFYRLGVVRIHVPPLRERGEDALLLAEYFLRKATAQYEKSVLGFKTEATSAIVGYGWPGNVRELENKIRRAVILSESRRLSRFDLNLPTGREEAAVHTLKNLRSQVERDHIQRILVRNNWNISKAASELGVSRPTLHDLIKKYEISKI